MTPVDTGDAAALFLLAGRIGDRLDRDLPQSLRDTLRESADTTTARPIFRWDGSALTTTDEAGAGAYIADKLRGSKKLLGYAAIDPEQVAGLASVRFTVNGKPFVIDPIGEDDLQSTALESYRPFLVWLRRDSREHDQVVRTVKGAVPNVFVDPLLFGERPGLTIKVIEEVLSEPDAGRVQCDLPYGLLLPPVFCPPSPADPFTGHFFDAEHTGIRRRFRAAFRSRYAGLRLAAVTDAADDPLLNAILVRGGWLELDPADGTGNDPVLRVRHANKRVDRYARDLLDPSVDTVGPTAPAWAAAVRAEFRGWLTTRIRAANLVWERFSAGHPQQEWRLRRLPRPSEKPDCEVVGENEAEARAKLHSAEPFVQFRIWLDGDRSDAAGQVGRLQRCLRDLAEGIVGEGGVRYSLKVNLGWFYANVGQYFLKPVLDRVCDTPKDAGLLFQRFSTKLPPAPPPGGADQAALQQFVKAILRLEGTEGGAWAILPPPAGPPPRAFYLREQDRLRRLLDYFAPREWRVSPFPHAGELCLSQTSVLL